MNCLDGNLNNLKKRKFVPVRWVNEAWVSISEEYARLTNDSGYDELISLSKEISRDSCRLMIINSCLNVLSKKYSKNSADILRNIGYKYAFNPDDPVKYRQDIERVSRQAKTISIVIEKNREKYDKLTAGNKITDHWESFNKTLISLSKYMGYHLDPDKLKVTQYIEISNQYKKEVEHTIKQKDGYRKNK